MTGMCGTGYSTSAYPGGRANQCPQDPDEALGMGMMVQPVVGARHPQQFYASEGGELCTEDLTHWGEVIKDKKVCLRRRWAPFHGWEVRAGARLRGGTAKASHCPCPLPKPLGSERLKQ